MKFGHIADAHIGGCREPRLRDANTKSFILAIDTCLQEQIDFLLISGDLFNTAVPSIDSLKMAVQQIKRVHDAGIPVYYIAGSHDFSPSGKTMLDVLQEAGLATNVAKGKELEDNRIHLDFTIDAKTGAKITGMIGKKGGLETGYYYNLAKEHLEQEEGYKIFLFHSALAELKPKELEKMDAMAVSLMPKGFDYYAGGHVHIVDRADVGEHKNIVYPGPIFPNNFSEIEKLKHGSFVIVDNGAVKHIPLAVHPTACIIIDADTKTPAFVEDALKAAIDAEHVDNAIVTIRVHGCLTQGKPSDIHWNDLFRSLYARNAYFVMKNTHALTAQELEKIAIKQASVEEVEEALLKEHGAQFKLGDNDLALAQELIRSLSTEKKDGERVADFEQRVIADSDTLFN